MLISGPSECKCPGNYGAHISTNRAGLSSEGSWPLGESTLPKRHKSPAIVSPQTSPGFAPHCCISACLSRAEVSPLPDTHSDCPSCCVFASSPHPPRNLKPQGAGRLVWCIRHSPYPEFSWGRELLKFYWASAATFLPWGNWCCKA